MPARYLGRLGEWSREASGVFFPEALETRRDDTQGYSRAQKATGPPPEISRDKAFQPKVTLGEVSREPFQTSGEPIVSFCNVSQTSREPTEGFCQMSPRYHETLEQVRVGLDAFEIRISSRDVSPVPGKFSGTSREPRQSLWRIWERIKRFSTR